MNSFENFSYLSASHWKAVSPPKSIIPNETVLTFGIQLFFQASVELIFTGICVWIPIILSPSIQDLSPGTSIYEEVTPQNIQDHVWPSTNVGLFQ